MDLWRSLAGMVEVELTSAEPAAALMALNAHGIAVYRVERQDELTVSFRLARRDCRTVKELCHKRGEGLRVRRSLGLYWAGKALLGRPVLVLGLALLLTATLLLPTRVLFVRVEGNVSVPARRILEAAQNCGITFGASSRAVRSERMKNSLLSAVPELQWAGVNTAGCVATISVRERAPAAEEPPAPQVASIVADRDGYILSATAIRGNLLVEPGQTVRAGQVLISGYTDLGLCIQATQAEGEVLAQTSRSLEAVTPANWTLRGDEGAVRRRLSLVIGKKRIFFWKDSGILDATCGRMDVQYPLTLPGGFQLPITLWVETYTNWETTAAPAERDRAQADLRDFADRYLPRQMIAGAIQRRAEDLTLEDGVYRLRGSYVCTEMIGRVRTEQIGESNGKDR